MRIGLLREARQVDGHRAYLLAAIFYICGMQGEILTATAADAEPLAALVNSAYRGDSSRMGWTTEADLLDGTRTDAAAITELMHSGVAQILKYVDAGEIKACVELSKRGDKLYLGMLTVSPLLQGMGIGKLMMRAAEREASRLNCTTIFMTVISVRTTLIEWYLRLGYRLTGETKPFAFNDARFGLPRVPLEFVVLEKQLP